MARKILLADDSVTAQNMGRKILADAGYEVITVNNGSAALKRISETRPDLVVLDVYMPGYSGLEVCQRLKESQETARIPVLLTVGKLEPFKPEEAKRVRAEGFIVKPFEASELLSALTRLEDKIVPLPETSKPGRSGRSAAVEESRFDRIMATEEDSGWKNRIAFPSGKKGKAAEEGNIDDSAIYNPVNKDLRTVLPSPPPHRPQEPTAESRVDLGALAPRGLPKDVTPEEIAALAAAAARIHGKVVETAVPEVPTAKPAPEPEPEARAEAGAQAPEPPQLASESLQEVPAAVPAEEAAAVKEREKETETPAAPLPEAATPPSVLPPSSPADVMSAIAALEPKPHLPTVEISGNGSGSHEPADEPATMAAAAGAGFGATLSRWVAVPVTLASEEAAISLEQEMQKAYAAFAAAETAHAAPAPAEAELVAVASEPVPALSMQEIAAVLNAVPEAGLEEAGKAIAGPEAEVSSFAGAPSAPSAEPEAASLPTTEGKTELKAEPEVVAAEAPAVEAKAEASSVAEDSSPVSEAIPAPPAPESAAATAAEPVEVPAVPEAAVAPAAAPEPQAASALDAIQPIPKEAEAEQKEQEPVAAASAEISPSAVVPETAAPVVSEVPAEPVLAREVSPQTTEVSAPAEPAAGGIDDMAKKEKEIAATTAAAWASWRRIRETGDTKPAAPGEPPAEEPKAEEPSVPEDAVAMAVAAGAEKAPEEVAAEPDSNAAEIASIVDSVLADLRPKIVEEISKKLGKKK